MVECVTIISFKFVKFVTTANNSSTISSTLNTGEGVSVFFNRFRRCFSAPCGEGERRGDGFTVSKTTPNLTKLLKPIPSNVLKVLVVGDFQKVV